MSHAVQVDVHLCPMETPSDVSAVRRLLDSGVVDARDVVAVIGKTEGSGLGRDPGREAADAALRQLFAERLGIDPVAVAERMCIILSGGTPGVLTPHVALLTRRKSAAPDTRPSLIASRLTVGLAHSAQILPEHVGRRDHVDRVALAVRQAMVDAGVSDPADVHLVLVKAPALTADGIALARGRGHDTVTTDLSIGPEGALCYSNDASALGVAVALGEVDDTAVTNAAIRSDWDLFSDVAITSSGGEKSHAEVLLLANSVHAAGDLRIGHHSMHDILDLGAVMKAVRSATGEALGLDTAAVRSSIVYLFAKMIIPGSDRIHGRRITLHDDPVGYHVAKAMGGYLLAATTGCTTNFVSGGERNSHQGPPEGNPLAAIVRVG